MNLTPQQWEDMQAKIALTQLQQQEDVRHIAEDGGPDMRERLERCEREYRRRYHQITLPLLDQ